MNPTLIQRFRTFWCMTFHWRHHSPSGWCHWCHKFILPYVMILLSCVSLWGQSWQDVATARNMNFDKMLYATDKWVIVQPPEGKVWIVVSGGIQIEKPVPGAEIVVWTETAPYHPYRDPATGEMIGCDRCVDILHADASGKHLFFPVVGGYEEGGLRGQTKPLVVAYPNRLILAIGWHGALPFSVQTWTRFTVIEKDLH